MEIKKCKYCGKEFHDLVGRVFSNHVRWCLDNPNRSQTQNIAASVHKRYNEKLGELKEYQVRCARCSQMILVREREHKHPEKKHYFCGNKCAHKRPQTLEVRQKKRDTFAKKPNSVPMENRICAECNKEFETKTNTERKFCCVKCVHESKKTASDHIRYKRDCQFKFSIWKFPKEFDLELVRQHGWYKAPNRGNNPGGVTRDHRISVCYGWKNNISPEVISHPANCKLMVHLENTLKNKDCSIDVSELIESINEWNCKYKN